MPKIPRELSLVVCDTGLSKVLYAVQEIEGVLPSAMIPHVQALECTKITEDGVWLTGGSVAFAYCAKEEVLSALSRIMSASCGRPITIHLVQRLVRGSHV